MAIPFSAVKKVGAERFTRALCSNTAGVTSLCFRGQWQDRRFVIVNLEPADLVTEPIHDLENLSLTLPVVTDPSFYVRECARFGAVVAAMFRSRKVFENAIGADGYGHVVHAFHHVALCGHKGQWCESKPEFAGACLDCQKVASTRPNHRARMHPLEKLEKKIIEKAHDQNEMTTD